MAPHWECCTSAWRSHPPGAAASDCCAWQAMPARWSGWQPVGSSPPPRRWKRAWSIGSRRAGRRWPKRVGWPGSSRRRVRPASSSAGQDQRDTAGRPPGGVFYSVKDPADDGAVASIQLADDKHDLALDFQAIRIVDVDRLHRRIGRLQPNPAALAVDMLEGGFLTVAQPDGDHVPVAPIVGPGHHHDVAVANHGVDHRVALDLQCEQTVVAGEQPARDFDRLIGAEDRRVGSRKQYRLAREDPADKRDA